MLRRRAPAAGVLGRATFPDADLWSCACAIQNLWLAARAEGLGLGWVTLFRPEELAGLVGLPEGVLTLGWLCLGWPDERPPEPGLVRTGWSRRQPLADAILHDRWPVGGVAPAPPPSHLRAPEQRAVVRARDAADLLLTPPGSLGVLDRVVALGRGDVDDGVLLLAAADHPVAALGVSAYDTTVTRDVAVAAVAGAALGVTAASAAEHSTWPSSTRRGRRPCNGRSPFADGRTAGQPGERAGAVTRRRRRPACGRSAVGSTTRGEGLARAR